MFLQRKNNFLILPYYYDQIQLNTIQDINQYLSGYELDIKDIEKKINIEANWNNLIYNKYKDKVNIDINKLKKKIKT